MALFASLRDPAAHVVRICRVLKIREMTADALSRRARKIAADMALGALHRRVRPRQRESGLGMVELRSQPVVHRVALRTVGRES